MSTKLTETRFMLILKVLSGLLLLLIFAQISLGSAIRLTGSGLSCPDWPLCYGLWFPDQDKLSKISDINFEFYQVMLEWIHRFNAAVFIAPLTFLVFFVGSKVINQKINKIVLWVILLVLALQGLIGGFTVFDKNSPWSVAAHLGFALIFMFLVLKIFLVSLKINLIFDIPDFNKKVFILSITIVSVLLTMLMGAIVSKSGSSLACDIWPQCSNDGISIFQYNKFVHIIHRFLALLSAISVFLVVIYYKDIIKYRIFDISRNILMTIIILQILMGAIVIFTELNLYIAMLHQSLAVILFMVLSFLYWFTLQINYKKH